MIVAYLCIALFSFLSILYFYFKYRFEKIVNTFKGQGINAEKPSFPFGNVMDMVRMKRNISDCLADVYSRFPEDRFVNFYMGTNPVFLIRDLELTKNIAIKHFDYFSDHSMVVDPKHDALFGLSLFCLKGDEWKQCRKTLGPAFSPSRLKAMTNLFVKASKQMVTHYREFYEVKKSKEANTTLEINVKDGMIRYLVDLTAMAGFGIDVNSFKEKDELFFKKTMKMADLNFWRCIKFFGFSTVPKVMQLLKLKLFSSDTVDFFTNIIAENIRYRKENNIHKSDFLDVIMRLGNGTLENDYLLDEKLANVQIKKDWSLDELTSQAAMFMIGGIETNTASFGFMLYELAMNQDVQKKLQLEIDAALAVHGELTYDVLQELEYLNMVMSESQRKYSMAGDRICVQDIDIGAPGPGEKPYMIKKGDWVMFSSLGIHRDPKYWPNPMKFDPERFSKANRQNIVPYSVFPFGIGPRICLGYRFAEISL